MSLHDVRGCWRRRILSWQVSRFLSNQCPNESYTEDICKVSFTKKLFFGRNGSGRMKIRGKAGVCRAKRTVRFGVSSMEQPSNPSATVPYSIIRNEKAAIHAVGIGSSLSVLSPLFLPRPCSTGVKGDVIDNKYDFAPLSLEEHPQETTWTSPKRPSNTTKLASSTVGQYGIFDSSSDEECIEELSDTLNITETRTKEIPSIGNPALRDIGNPSSFSPTPLKGVLVYVGTSTGSIGIYESETGRLLDRIDEAHGTSSVLLVEELAIDHESIKFASQGRDGYIRFWSITLCEGESPFPSLPELILQKKHISVQPCGSPVFVGGEAFCRSSFCKLEKLVATVVERGTIAIWSYAETLAVNALGDRPLVPKCVVSYEGDVHGMCMSLQLLSSSLVQPTTLFAGFEDGSILVWSLTPTETSSPTTPSQLVFYQVANLRAFTATPVLSMALRSLTELLEHQTLSRSTCTIPSNANSLELADRDTTWLGICTSSEEEIIVFSFQWTHLHQTGPSATLQLREKYLTPHTGYQDSKMREDSLVAVAGWDHRIRLFLLDLSADANSKISITLRPLTILKHHSASIQALALDSASTSLLASASSDQRVAIWHVY